MWSLNKTINEKGVPRAHSNTRLFQRSTFLSPTPIKSSPSSSDLRFEVEKYTVTVVREINHWSHPLNPHFFNTLCQFHLDVQQSQLFLWNRMKIFSRYCHYLWLQWKRQNRQLGCNGRIFNNDDAGRWTRIESEILDNDNAQFSLTADWTLNHQFSINR